VIPLIDEKLPDDRDILTAKPVGAIKATGMGFMKGAADIAGASTLILGGIQGFFGNKRGQEKTYNFYDKFIEPAKEYWSPDPASTSMAGKIFGGIAGLGPSLLLGPAAIPTLIGTSAINTGVELVDSGVDATTATLAGIGSGLVSAAQIKLPASGKTLGQTLGLMAANPVIGAGQAQAIKTLLEAQGYNEKAKQYDPFDPVGRSIDTVLGLFFGGTHYYGKIRKKLPIEVEDAIDTIAAHQKSLKDTPFEPTNKNTRVSLQAKEKAMADISSGKPVDVSEHIEELTRGKMTETPTLDTLISGFKEHMPNLTDAQLEGTKFLVEKRAAMEGMHPDEYVSKRFAWIESGDELGKAQFFQKESIKYQIGELYDYTVGSKDNALKKVDLGELNSTHIEAIKQATGHDLTGYKRVIDNYAIKHILNEHGDAKKEAARGLIPVTKEDITKIPDIIENPDSISPAGKTRVGRDSILYEKRFNGIIYYLEEKRIGNNEVAAVTLYKKKAATSNAHVEGAPSVTSETLRGSDSNIPPLDDSVNRLEQAHNNVAKGAVEFLQDGRAVIHAFDGADISTVMHELAHVWRRDLRGDDLRIIADWAGVEKGKWERQHEEQFAKGFERYLAEGKAPSEELKGVFERFKTWILDVYRSLVKEDVWRTNLNPDVRKVMDRLFVEAELPFKKTEHPEAVEARKVADEAVRELNDETARVIDIEIPKEITTIEDWGASETFMPKKGRGKKQHAQIEPPLKKGTGDIEPEIASSPKEYSRPQIEFIKDMADMEGPQTIRTINETEPDSFRRIGSGRPRWMQDIVAEYGYKYDEIPALLDRYMEGKLKTEKQRNFVEAILEASKRDYRKVEPILNEPVERVIEDIFTERDITYFKGYDAEGKEIHGSMMEYIDDAKAEYRKVKSLEDVYERIGNCLRNGG